MINNLRFELSFKNISELEKKIQFCLSNKINKINIPCKGLIKKSFLDEVVDYIDRNFSDLDIVYHYSLFHQYSKNPNLSYSNFLEFIKKSCHYNKREILLISGSTKKKNFETLEVLNNFKKEKISNVNLGVAYNPYLNNHFYISGERDRFEEKISSGLISSIWLQFGTDISLLETEIYYLKKYIKENKENYKNKSLKIFGSLLIPSRQFISRFRFRPWKGVYISEDYLSSIERFDCFIKDLINLYDANGINPVIESECSSPGKLEKIYKIFEQ